MLIIDASTGAIVDANSTAENEMKTELEYALL